MSDFRLPAFVFLQASPTPAAAAGDGDSANWLVFELLWRDFFRFMTKKYTDTTLGGTGQAASAPAYAGYALA